MKQIYGLCLRSATFYLHPLSAFQNDNMKNRVSIYPALAALFFMCLISLQTKAGNGQQTVNAILGDESYRLVFATEPDANTNEQFRLQLHLAYVENRLRQQSTSKLSIQQQQNRLQVLDLLAAYWQAGIFPTNKRYLNERRPCFIDDEGRLCAVGFLLAATKGIDAAKSINTEYQYEYVMNMKSALLEEWADTYGLTLEECAMIQPTYGPPPPDQTAYAELKSGYAVPSAILSGGNLALSIAQLRGVGSKGWHYAAMVGGGGQLILGLANIRKSHYSPYINGGGIYTRYRAQNNLSYFNIAMGTATLVTSAIHLMARNRKTGKGIPVSVYGYPNEANSVSMGLSYSYRF